MAVGITIAQAPPRISIGSSDDLASDRGRSGGSIAGVAAKSFEIICFGMIAVLLLCMPMAAQSGASSVSAEINIGSADLLAPLPAENWISYNGDYSGRRYSQLTQIDTGNVARLRAAWVFHARNSDHLEVTPQVANGVMFVTAANDVFALDAQTGRAVWHYARPITQGLIDDASRHISRGVALWHDRVFRETD
ncbi:MAG: hypothetical protein JF563_06065, partial [Acidobacteriales bacterium]|nr:hypothetical protein [Terriglobales bacterium]